MTKTINTLLIKPAAYENFKTLYEDYFHIETDRLSDIYTEEVFFKDPIHSLEGITLLKKYFAQVSDKLVSCRFEFIDELVTQDCAHITWNMHFQHTAIAGGKLTTLRGMSFIKFNEKVYFHEDAYDLGAMVYEHIPLLGKLTTFIKGRIGK